MKHLISFFIILFLYSPLFSQNFDKYIEKYQKYYDNGDFDKAAKINEKLKNKSIKKLGTENKYLPYAYLNEAELQFNKQLILGIDEALKNSILTSEKISGKESPEYNQILRKSIKLYAALGNYSMAENLIYTLDSIDEISPNLELQLIEVYLKQGSHTKSLELISDHLDEFRNRATNGKGGKSERKLSKIEYSIMLNYATENFLLKGELQKADSVLNSYDAWFNKNLSKEDKPSVHQELLFAGLYNGRNEIKEAQKFYEKAYQHSKNGRKSYAKFVLEIHEQLILAYIRYNKKNKISSEIEDFKKLIKDNYSKKSYLNQVVTYVEMEKLIGGDGDPELIRKTATTISYDASTLPKFHEFKIKAFQQLYELAILSDDFNSALVYLESIIETKRNLYGASSPKFHIAQLQLANFYLEYTNKIQSADSIYQISWEQVVKDEIASEHKNYITIKNKQARYYEAIDQFDLASKTLDEATIATIHAYDRTDINFAVQLNKIANLQISLGEYKKAEKYLQMAMEVFNEQKIRDKNAFYYSNTLVTEARLFTARGMFDEAEKNLKKAKKLIAKTDINLIKKTNSSGELANIYFQLGKYNESEKLIRSELSRIERIYEKDSKNRIPLLVILGKIKLAQGDYTTAEQLARKVLSLSKDIYGPNSSHSIPATMLLAEISSTFGDFENSQLHLEKSKELLLEKLGKDHIWLAEIYSRIGTNMLSKSEDPKEIELLFNEAKDIILDELDDQSPRYADMLKKLAYVKITQKDYSQAFQFLFDAEAIWVSKAGKRNNINASEIYVLLGDVYYMLRNFDQAEEYYLKAKALYEKFFSQNHPEYVKVLAKLSRVEYMMGNEKAALMLIEEVIDNYGNYINYFFPALSEREKAKFWSNIKEDYEYYNTIVLKQIENPNDKKVGKLFNNALHTKALLLNSSIKMRQNIVNSGDSILIVQYENWILSKEILSESLSMSFEQLTEYDINLDSLISEVEQLEKKLSKQSEFFSSSTGQLQISWENIKSALKKNEVAIEMMNFRYFDHVFTDSVIYMALIIKNNKNSDRPEVVVLKNGRELENKYFKYYKNMIMYKMEDTYSYTKFWKPIEDRVGKNTTIYFSPDGVYTQMNLEAIMVEDDRYVIDNSNIILVSNTKDLYLKSHRKKKEDAENMALMFGDPEFYVSANPKYQKGRNIIQSLPGTEKEVKKISELLQDHGWKTEFYVQHEASEEEVKKLSNPKVFHIATHGFYTSERAIDYNIKMIKTNSADAMKNPLLRSGLMLKGAGDVLAKTNFNYNIESGILTAYEAMNLNLDYTDLVVLSACETGVGDISAGEGVYGLQRAFLVAGAKVLIMSMFKVSDEVTYELMSTFYNKWLSSGEIRISFTETKKELRNKYPEPIYWGAFVMFGLE